MTCCRPSLKRLLLNQICTSLWAVTVSWPRRKRWVSGEVKQQALERADIFVLPSYNEGLPMSILEAMAQGLPVIATRVGGIPEAVMHGQTGLLFDAGDQAALREALLELARLGAGRAAMGQAGYALARQVFSEQAVVPQIKHLYRELGMV